MTYTKTWVSSRLADWLRAGGGLLLLPQLASPYLLSSALSWVTIWGCIVATWTPPPRPPTTPPPPPPLTAPLRPGCSASVAGDGTWGWGSGWVGPQASRGGSGGWKVGEVSCGCFLFTVLVLRGAGSGCLLTVLGRGGEGRGERIQEGKPHAIRQNERAGDRKQWEQRQTERDSARDRKRHHFLSLWNQLRKKNPKKGHKTTWQWPFK